MTALYKENIAIRYAGPEGLSSASGRRAAEALIAAMEAADVPGSSVAFTLQPDCIETNASSADDVERRLLASGRNREGHSEWYIDVEPVTAASPSRFPSEAWAADRRVEDLPQASAEALGHRTAH